MNGETGCPRPVEAARAAFLAWSDPPGEPDRLTPASEVFVTASPLLSPDHLDLLATAAVTYRVLTAPPAALLAGATNLVAVSAAAAGKILRDQNLAASSSSATTTIDYEFRPVTEPLDPVEVLKACHCYEDTCRAHTSWERSLAHRLIRSIERAATQRIPGYTDAPWRWLRSSRWQPPVGFATEWRPEVSGLNWVNASELALRWDQARLVVITTDAVPNLPPGLRRRPAVIALHNGVDLAGLQALWSDLATDAMVWPMCRTALQVALSEPAEMLL